MKIWLMLVLFFCCAAHPHPHIPLYKQCKFDNSAYFEEGDATTILNFEAKILKDVMDEHYGLIIEFSLCQLPGESEQLGQQRFRIFRDLLEKEKIDLERIQFSSELHYYTLDQLAKQHLKPGIFGIVQSI